MLFTTSWDDGYALDITLANLLEKYGATGTFYICPQAQHGHAMLTEVEIKTLHKNHEIGAHSMTHPKLNQIDKEVAAIEISNSKQWVEKITNTECAMFCYPYGFYNEHTKLLVKNAGFRSARTTEHMQFSVTDSFAMPTSLQITPFPKRKQFSRWWHPVDLYGPRRVRSNALKALGIKPKGLHSWVELAKTLFDTALKNDEQVFHLWGHSHEIERYDMWGELEQFLQHVETSGVKCVTNAKIL